MVFVYYMYSTLSMFNEICVYTVHCTMHHYGIPYREHRSYVMLHIFIIHSYIIQDTVSRVNSRILNVVSETLIAAKIHLMQKTVK